MISRRDWLELHRGPEVANTLLVPFSCGELLRRKRERSRWSADILSASGRSTLRLTNRIPCERLFALRAQADRMSALRR
jgi:hypothetical protein